MINRKRLIIALFALFIAVFAGCARNVAVPVQPETLPFSDQIVYGKLDNGIQYYIQTNDFPTDTIELRLNVRSGSLNETDDEQGIAHFVEHMAFNGTVHFDGNDLIKFMEEVGLVFGQHTNAYTSADNTNYQITVPVSKPELLDDSFSFIRDWADGITFDPEEIEKEKGVITEEWRSRNTVQNRLRLQSRDYMLAGSRYVERDPIGKMDIIASANRDLLVGYYDKWYTPENISVIVVGNIDAAEAERLIKKHFSSLEPRPMPQKADSTVPLTEGLRIGIISDPEASGTSAGLIYFKPEGQIETYEHLKQNTLETGAMNMLNKRISAKILENNSPLLSFRGMKIAHSYGVSFTQFGITSDPATLENDIKEMLIEIERAKRFGFTQEELDEFVTSQQTFLTRAASPDFKYESENYAAMIAEYDTYGGYLTDFAQDKTLTDRIFAETGLTNYNNAFNSLLETDSILLLITAPERNRAGITIDEAVFTRLAEEAAAEELTAGATDMPIEKLIAEEPQPGKIASRTRYENIGAELITYENGARLFVRPNSIDRNKFMLMAKKSGGLSVLNDTEAIYSGMIPQVMAASGFDGISRRQLQQYMAGKQVGISPSFSEYTFDFSGEGDVKDIETMFQLYYKFITAPDIDDNALAAIIKSTGVALANVEKDKKTIFMREASLTMNNDAYRRTYLLSSDLPDITADALMDIYKNNFTDVSNFVFVISGDVDIEQAAELGAKYLGSFPAAKPAAGAVDRGVHLRKQFARLDGYGDVENRSSVMIRFDNDAEHMANAEYFSTVARIILSQRLRESIREDLGAAYSVGAFIRQSDYPAPSFSGGIAFTCDPARRDEIITEAIRIMDEMAKNGVTAAELESAISQQLTLLDSAGERNSYWAGNISFDYIAGEPFVSIEEERAIMNGLKLDDVNKFISEFMGGARKFVAAYNPDAENASK